MKERIVIDNNQHLPRASYYVAKDGHYDVGTVNYATPETILNENRIVAVKEQVPETWEELKTMCEELEGKTMDVTCDVLEDEIDVTIWNIDRSHKVGFAEFYYDGDKVHLFMGTGFSIPIEIPKVWAFIKSLIGEE